MNRRHGPEPLPSEKLFVRPNDPSRTIVDEYDRMTAVTPLRIEVANEILFLELGKTIREPMIWLGDLQIELEFLANPDPGAKPGDGIALHVKAMARGVNVLDHEPQDMERRHIENEPQTTNNKTSRTHNTSPSKTCCECSSRESTDHADIEALANGGTALAHDTKAAR